MNAEWRDVVGYEGRYRVSNQGDVWSVASNRAMRGYVTGAGYRRLSLSGGGAATFVLVHRVVLEAFVGPCPDGLVTRHLDGNPLNNALSNLTYGTYTENNLDILRHGTHRNRNKTHCTNGHEYNDANTYWRKRDGYQHRQCRACMAATTRRYMARKAVAA